MYPNKKRILYHLQYEYYFDDMHAEVLRIVFKVNDAKTTFYNAGLKWGGGREGNPQSPASSSKGAV